MLKMNAMIDAYLEYGMSKQLRERTLQSYAQGLRLFAVWLDALFYSVVRRFFV